MEAEDDMPGQVFGPEWGEGMIIHENQIRIRAGNDLTDGCGREEDIGQGGVVIDCHIHHNISIHPARVEVMEFVDENTVFHSSHMALEKPSLPNPTFTPDRNMDSTGATPTALFMFERS